MVAASGGRARVAISGGGTGGHISPALAVGAALEEMLGPDRSDVVYYATTRPVDAAMYGEAGVRWEVLDSPRIDTGGMIARLLLPARSARALLRARAKLVASGASVAFGTGGYPSFFMLLAARTLRIPCALHESNSRPGRANRLASRFCKEVYVGFGSACDRFGDKAVHTGNPVRSAMERMPRSDALRELGLDPEGPVVLFLGGSQG
ncbi:glycosyltransferase, partial [Candidatus Fermentibacterales bacterium]|nr:glycosyltransferase [Candidatus Fermentibacterales bacterium]